MQKGVEYKIKNIKVEKYEKKEQNNYEKERKKKE